MNLTPVTLTPSDTVLSVLDNILFILFLTFCLFPRLQDPFIIFQDRKWETGDPGGKPLEMKMQGLDTLTSSGGSSESLKSAISSLPCSDMRIVTFASGDTILELHWFLNYHVIKLVIEESEPERKDDLLAYCKH